MAASTPRRCLRRESLWIHSSTSCQASSRVGLTAGQGIRRLARTRLEMTFGTLAQPLVAPTRAALRMEKFIIEGGYPLSGTVVPAGNKNAALPLLAASLLTEEEVVLRNIPRIRDVEAMIQLLIRLGVNTSWLDENVICLRADEVGRGEVDE